MVLLFCVVFQAWSYGGHLCLGDRMEQGVYGYKGR